MAQALAQGCSIDHFPHFIRQQPSPLLFDYWRARRPLHLYDLSVGVFQGHPPTRSSLICLTLNLRASEAKSLRFIERGTPTWAVLTFVELARSLKHLVRISLP